MSFLACFDETVNKALLHNSKTLDAEARCAEISLVTDGAIRILKTDNDLVKLFPLITQNKGNHSIADYCVFTESSIIICDLKSGKSEKAKCQIENTRLLIDYLIKFIKHHYKLADRFMPDIHYAVFSGIVSKGLSKPTKPIKKNYRGFEYYELGCGGKYRIKDLCSN